MVILLSKIIVSLTTAPGRPSYGPEPIALGTVQTGEKMVPAPRSLQSYVALEALQSYPIAMFEWQYI